MCFELRVVILALCAGKSVCHAMMRGESAGRNFPLDLSQVVAGRGSHLLNGGLSGRGRLGADSKARIKVAVAPRLLRDRNSERTFG
jgi:hypothetical protein